MRSLFEPVIPWVVPVNQRVDGGEWNLLGVYDLSPSSGAKVEVTNDANGSVSADAVRAILHTTDEVEFEIDNTDASFTSGWFVGTAYGEAGQGIYREENWYFAPAGAGATTLSWPVDVPAAGKYQLFARWTDGTDRSSAAPYTVHHDGGTTLVELDQRTQGNVWMPLGLFDLTPSSGQKVVLSDLADGKVVADAIKVVPLEMDTHVVSADAVKFVANDAEDVLYVHADHLGAPQKMTDASRTVVWDAAFTPFGEEHSILGTETNDNRFPGQYFDGETGFHYNYQRDYDPTTGRYLQSDPIGLAGGLNTYGYVLANPIRYTDPEGLNPLAGAIGGGAVAGPVGAVVGLGIGLGIGHFAWDYFFGDEGAAGGEVCTGPRKPAIADAEPGDLCEQLALAEAKAGAGEVIMNNLADEPRLVAHYGKGPWVKKQHTHNCFDGRKLVIHYFHNPRTGQNVELKFV